MKKSEIIEALKELEIDFDESLKKDDLEEILEKAQSGSKPEEKPEPEEKKPVPKVLGFIVKNNSKRNFFVADEYVKPGKTKELTKEEFAAPKVQHALKCKRIVKV